MDHRSGILTESMSPEVANCRARLGLALMLVSPELWDKIWNAFYQHRTQCGFFDDGSPRYIDNKIPDDDLFKILDESKLPQWNWFPLVANLFFRAFDEIEAPDPASSFEEIICQIFKEIDFSDLRFKRSAPRKPNIPGWDPRYQRRKEWRDMVDSLLDEYCDEVEAEYRASDVPCVDTFKKRRNRTHERQSDKEHHIFTEFERFEILARAFLGQNSTEIQDALDHEHPADPKSINRTINEMCNRLEISCPNRTMGRPRKKTH